MEEANPEPQEQEIASQVEQVEESQEVAGNSDQSESAEQNDTRTVPLTALQKSRKKAQMLQEERDYYRNLAEQPQKEDDSKYETATREDLANTRKETFRDFTEHTWANENPEKTVFVETELEEFLRARPHLGPALQNAPNRLQEAYELLTALSPKQREKTSQQPARKDVPGSPGGVPKAASMNQGVDVMNMSDTEFREWRNTKRKRR